MQKFDYDAVEEAAKQVYIKALTDLPPDVRGALQRAYERESQPPAKEIFKAMFKAIEIADRKKTLVCQDTGLPIYMVKMGSDFPWNGAEIKKRLPGQFHPYSHSDKSSRFGRSRASGHLLGFR
jgi:fumarate hydratase subunit alpha